MLVAHLVLMYVITGDPLHLFKVVTGQVSRDFIGKGGGEDAAGYYFRYLFLDIKHTWIVAFLACAGIALFVRARWRGTASGDGTTRVDRWIIQRGSRAFDRGGDVVRAVLVHRHGAGAVDHACFTVAAALRDEAVELLDAVPGTRGVARRLVHGVARNPAQSSPLIGLVIVGGVLLGAFEQQAYRVVTSNSKAALALLDAYPQATIYGTSNNSNIAAFQSMIEGVPSIDHRVDTYSALAKSKKPPDDRGGDRLVVLDRETWNWGGRFDARRAHSAVLVDSRRLGADGIRMGTQRRARTGRRRDARAVATRRTGSSCARGDRQSVARNGLRRRLDDPECERGPGINPALGPTTRPAVSRQRRRRTVRSPVRR